jgi:hypothetical protein
MKMADTMSFVTLAGVIAFALILWYYNQRQASALKEMARALEETYMIAVKNRRDAHKQQEFNCTASDWISKQLDGDIRPVSPIKVSNKPMWANLRCASGERVVVSPLTPIELRAALKDQRTNSKLDKVEEPLLGTNRNVLSVRERSLRENEWFDLEADKVGKQLGVNWGETSRLYFYIVRNKA